MKPPWHPGERRMNPATDPPLACAFGDRRRPVGETWRNGRWTSVNARLHSARGVGSDRGGAGGSRPPPWWRSSAGVARRDRRGGGRNEPSPPRRSGREQQLDAVEDRRVRDLTLSTMREGLLLIGSDARVAFANDAIGRHLPSTPTTLDTVLPFTLRSAIEESRERGRPNSVLVETGVPTRWLRGTITPAADGATLVVVRDVTEQRQLDAVRRDFVANASHELKTPAATIQAAAETLRQVVEDDPDAVARFAVQLEREAIRLSRIVADLLDLSRLESGSSLDDLVSLGAATREEAQRLEEAARDAGVALEIETSRERPIRGSAERPRVAGAEPRRQRDPVQPRRERGPGRDRVRGRRRDAARQRHRDRHPVEGHPPDLRALLPGGPGSLEGDGRHRTRTRDREARGGEPRWHDGGRQRARARHDVRDLVPRGAPPRRDGWSRGADRASPPQSAAISDRRGGGSGAGTIESFAPNAPRKRSRIVLGRQPAGTGAMTSTRPRRRVQVIVAGSPTGIRRCSSSARARATAARRSAGRSFGRDHPSVRAEARVLAGVAAGWRREPRARCARTRPDRRW